MIRDGNKKKKKRDGGRERGYANVLGVASKGVSVFVVKHCVEMTYVFFLGCRTFFAIPLIEQVHRTRDGKPMDMKRTKQERC